MYDHRVSRLKTPEDCEQFAKNVEETHPDLARQARRRAVELRALKYDAKTEAEQDALRAIYAFEEVRSKETGRKARASRTWQSINRNGIIATVEKTISKRKVTDGYAALVEAGLEDFTFEAVVLRHPETFSAETIRIAEERLKEINM
jgi:predicted acetyltransferase